MRKKMSKVISAILAVALLYSTSPAAPALSVEEVEQTKIEEQAGEPMNETPTIDEPTAGEPEDGTQEPEKEQEPADETNEPNAEATPAPTTEPEPTAEPTTEPTATPAPDADPAGDPSEEETTTPPAPTKAPDEEQTEEPDFSKMSKQEQYEYLCGLEFNADNIRLALLAIPSPYSSMYLNHYSDDDLVAEFLEICETEEGDMKSVVDWLIQTTQKNEEVGEEDGEPDISVMALPDSVAILIEPSELTYANTFTVQYTESEAKTVTEAGYKNSFTKSSTNDIIILPADGYILTKVVLTSEACYQDPSARQYYTAGKGNNLLTLDGNSEKSFTIKSELLKGSNEDWDKSTEKGYFVEKIKGSTDLSTFGLQVTTAPKPKERAATFVINDTGAPTSPQSLIPTYTVNAPFYFSGTSSALASALNGERVINDRPVYTDDNIIIQFNTDIVESVTLNGDTVNIENRIAKFTGFNKVGDGTTNTIEVKFKNKVESFNIEPTPFPASYIATYTISGVGNSSYASGSTSDLTTFFNTVLKDYYVGMNLTLTLNLTDRSYSIKSVTWNDNTAFSTADHMNLTLAENNTLKIVHTETVPVVTLARYDQLADKKATGDLSELDTEKAVLIAAGIDNFNSLSDDMRDGILQKGIGYITFTRQATDNQNPINYSGNRSFNLNECLTKKTKENYTDKHSPHWGIKFKPKGEDYVFNYSFQFEAYLHYLGGDTAPARNTYTFGNAA